jgi:hypothetical protein
MLSDWIRLLLIKLTRLFVNPDFANWSGEDGQMRWIGRWDGLSSLYNPSTLCLSWLCLLLTVAVWFARPARRPAVVWVLAVFLAAVCALSGVFACFAHITSLNSAIGYTADAHGARYLLPVLAAWFATLLMLLFREEPARESLPGSTPTACAGDTASEPPNGASP